MYSKFKRFSELTSSIRLALAFIIYYFYHTRAIILFFGFNFVISAIVPHEKFSSPNSFINKAIFKFQKVTANISKSKIIIFFLIMSVSTQLSRLYVENVCLAPFYYLIAMYMQYATRYQRNFKFSSHCLFFENKS